MITLPSWVPGKPRLNFITLHYIYIIGMVTICSIMLYPIKNMDYIDCIFHASGASTQSGLNTKDLNLMTLYQQIVIMIISWFTNPIVINTAVVFIRLYWFEKRFESVVQEAKNRLITRRTKSKEVDNPDHVERGVGNREIRVLHQPRLHLVEGPDGMRLEPVQSPGLPPPPRHSSENRPQSGDPEKTDGHHVSGLRRLTEEDIPAHRKYKDDEDDFAIDDEEDHDDNASKLKTNGNANDSANGNANGHAIDPVNKHTNVNDVDYDNPPFSPTAQHIAFVETQRGRGRKNSSALHVPSPREFENGGVIRAHIDDIVDADGHDNHIIHGHDAVEPMKRTITIDAPETNHATHAIHASGTRLRMRRFSDAAKGTVERMFTRNTTLERVVSNTFKRHRSSSPASRKTTVEPMPYLSYTPTIGRNSAFVNLTDEQRDELGGIEYRSLKVLAYILVFYTIFWHFVGWVSLTAWILHAGGWGQLLTRQAINKVWWGIFTGSAAFIDLGFTLTPDSMASFSTATYVLLVMGFLIIIGNTGFPCFLRFKIWFLWKIMPNDSSTRECLHFLLDHPRRCFTLLFPSKATWWLFAILVILNLVDVILFIILDLKDSTVTSIPVGYRILDALFQAISTRTAGFSVVNLADLHPAIQVSYMVMMYISIFPVAISVRRTNVYEERSLGIYGSPEEEEGPQEPSFVGAHLRKQLSFDLWYIFMGLFLITIAEGKRIEDRSDWAFTTFTILFEVVSAYGTVGLSLGYPNTNPSFSGQLTTFSKFIIVMMQIRGRHRGLPYELDRAILLPSESLQNKEAEDAKLRHQRRASMSTLGGPGFPRTNTGRSGMSVQSHARTTGRDEGQRD